MTAKVTDRTEDLAFAIWRLVADADSRSAVIALAACINRIEGIEGAGCHWNWEKYKELGDHLAMCWTDVAHLNSNWGDGGDWDGDEEE